ncbi:hypothetical protein NIES4102_08990 [Chondrocystis sp. NIES-4102]|nr:hypothetical protein NIES4102_08990 [Chondrocystis sp. NIES-4102]
MNSNLLSQLKNQLWLFTLGILSLIVIINLQSEQVQKISEVTLDKEAYLKQQEAEKIRLSFLKQMPTFDFNNLVANWTMLQFLQYFGDNNARNITGYSLSADYLDVIAQNDPLFSRAYMIISPASSMFAGTPERTVAIMNEGLTQMSASTPDAYYVWLYKGVDEILFLGDLQAAKNSYQMSSAWANKAGNETIAQAAKNTVKFLATTPDTRQAQVGVWFMVWNNNKDERIRKIAQTKIEDIGGELKIYSNGRVEAIPPKLTGQS